MAQKHDDEDGPQYFDSYACAHCPDCGKGNLKRRRTGSGWMLWDQDLKDFHNCAVRAAQQPEEELDLGYA